MSRYFAVIPAAGMGSRMGGLLPKQYLAIGGRPLLYYSIARLCAHPNIERVFVILSQTDQQFESYDWGQFTDKLDPVYAGGDTRAATVRNALDRLSSHAHADDWVLVHDAARPCLSASMLERLIAEVGDDSAGGLLAVPVADTLKRSGDDCRAVSTKSRTGLWQAQTPQMFRYALLARALRNCDEEQATDESAAVEALGIRPKLVQSDTTNFKVTHAQDLALAKLLLHNYKETL